MNIDRHKILLIAPLPPPVHGAANVSRQILDSERISSEFDFRSINISTSRTLAEIGNFSCVKIFRYLFSLWQTVIGLVRFKPDLCYLAITCHGSAFLKDAPFVMLCKLFGKKVIIHQHNKGMALDIDRPFFRRLLPAVYKNAKVILLSWRLYPDVCGAVEKKNVLICPNGVKSSAPGDFIHKPKGVSHILFLSNLLVEKGVLVLLDALELLAHKGYTFVCDFVGSETKEISAICLREEVLRKGLDGSVIYHGGKFGEEKKKFFEEADIFVLPTLNEAFPLVILEAMDYKLPVITTDVGGITDMVTDRENGLVVEPNDSGSLATAIANLIDSPELRRHMGENGRKMMSERFTDSIFENNIIKSLKESI